MESAAALDRRASPVVPLQGMLAVSARTHWVHKFLTEWLELKRMMAGIRNAVVLRKVVEVSRSRRCESAGPRSSGTRGATSPKARG